MAYEFTAASSQSLNTTSTPITGVPLTLSAWVRCDSLPSAQSCIFGIGLNTTINTQYITLELNSVNRPQITQRFGSTNAVTTAPSGSITAGQWFHVCGIFPSDSSRSIYWDGVFRASNTTSVTPFTAARLQVGRRPNIGSGSAFLTGQVAECGAWDIDLTAAEIASLAAGMTCDKVRPQNLVFYAPLVRDLIDAKGGLTITNNNGATVANHPRVYA